MNLRIEFYCSDNICFRSPMPENNCWCISLYAHINFHVLNFMDWRKLVYKDLNAMTVYTTFLNVISASTLM